MSLLVDALRAEGFDVTTVDKAGLREVDDDAVLQWAAENGYILLTWDKRTIPPLLKRWSEHQQQRAGVIVCEQALKDAVGTIVCHLRNVARVHSNETLRNAAIWLGAIWD